MIKVNLICVGKIREKHFADACREYEKRLSRFCKLRVIETPECTDGDVKRILSREEESILRAFEGKIILFDRLGEKFSSEKFSSLITNLSANGETLSFVIGGSFGVSSEIRERANRIVSVSDMTFPHMLFRVMAEEQIYRAFMISSGSEYHK